MKRKIASRILNLLSIFATFGLLIFLFVFSSSNNANGYNAKSYNWSNDPSLRIAILSFPSGSVWRFDLENGIGRWNGMWGMWLEYDYSFSSYSSFSTGDGDNNVAFLSSGDVDGAWGVTWTRHSGGDILETDIGFNADIGWNTGAQDERERDESQPAFRKVIVHELGHALGLKHYCSELAQMAQGYAGHVWHGGSEKYRHHPSPDDCEGARYQYPYTANTEVDISLMNFEMDGSCDSHVWRDNSLVTTVAAGDMVDIEYTVCNLGNVGSSFSVGIYLSTNDYISKYDTYLGGVAYYITDHYASEEDRTYRIPCSVPAGTCYIGAVVDPENRLSEVRESNNHLVFPGKWQVTAPVGQPDLIVKTLLHSPYHPTTKDKITFSALVRNIGCGVASSSTLAIRVGGETVPATYSIPTLGAGEGHIVHRQANLEVAQNYLNTAIADYNNDVAESDETNNQKTDSYTVTN
jgi:hypothetical protein